MVNEVPLAVVKTDLKLLLLSHRFLYSVLKFKSLL